MAKLNRIYKLTVQLQDKNGKPIDKALVITNPIGISFSVERGIYAQQQSLDINIYNLNREHRGMLFRDVFMAGQYLMITLEADYEDVGLSTIFSGFVWSAYSSRQGVNVITKIQALTNLGAQASYTSATLKKGSTLKDVVGTCMKDMPQYTEGKQSIQDLQFEKPIVLADNSVAIMKKYTEKDVFTDLMKVNILDKNECFKGYIPKLTSANGLLGTPERRDATLTIRTMFEPRIMVGQIIEIDSDIAPEFNGQYKVYGINHTGDINDAQGGTLVTTLQLQVGSQVFGRFHVIA